MVERPIDDNRSSEFREPAGAVLDPAALRMRLPVWLERRLPHFNIERPEADDEALSAIEDARENGVPLSGYGGGRRSSS